MANKEHLTILNKGSAEWNLWRKQNPSIKPDLTNVDLRKYQFRYYNDFSDVNMPGANLSGVDLEGNNFSGANLKGANLSKAKASRATRFDNANLQDANFQNSKFKYASFSGADFRGATFKYLKMENVNFEGADLRLLDLNHLDLTDANLSNANLTGTNLNFTNLTEARFKNAILHQSKLVNAQIVRTDLTNANLHGSNIFNAVFKETILEGTDFTNCIANGTMFVDTDLRVAKGLEKIDHYGPSHIDIDTIYLSEGRIPHEFLSGAGIPENFINHIHSFANQAVNLYSCFISYSSIDQAFAERIYADLKNNGVRCWFAPKDMKGGQKTYQQIDRAIRIHDKLLLVLSKNSINSEWVKTEIRRTRQAELKQNRQKLFPIRLINIDALKKWECFDADTGKDLAVEVREYHIPNFSNWKNYDSYQDEFTKLLMDLNLDKFID